MKKILIFLLLFPLVVGTWAQEVEGREREEEALKAYLAKKEIVNQKSESPYVTTTSTTKTTIGGSTPAYPEVSRREANKSSLREELRPEPSASPIIRYSSPPLSSQKELSESIENPFRGMNHFPPDNFGRLDLSLYSGIGFTNLGMIDILGEMVRVSLSFDFLLGLGFNASKTFSLGIETGISWSYFTPSGSLYSSFLNGLRPLTFFIEQNPSLWSSLTNSWLDSHGLQDGMGKISHYWNLEIPLRFYTKLNLGEKVFRWLSLQGFVGVDFSLNVVTLDMYRKSSTPDSYDYRLSASRFFFAPNFTTGVKLSFGGIGIEYSYHVPIVYPYGIRDYFKAREHRISMGASINLSL